MLGVVLLVVVLLVVPMAAVDLDVTPQDVERALSIARSRDSERARFHAAYIRHLDTASIEKVEVVTEYRRVVLMAEERARKGDRMFGYSVSLATQAVGPWKRRVSVVARLRFHPQNNYVTVPGVDISLDGNASALIGVLREPVLSLPSSDPGDRLPVLGAVVEGVFDAEAVGPGVREFAIRVDHREIARVRFDLDEID